MIRLTNSPSESSSPFLASFFKIPLCIEMEFMRTFPGKHNKAVCFPSFIELTPAVAFCFLGNVHVKPISIQSGILKNKAKKGEEDSLGEFVSLIMCGMFPISH